MIRLLQRPVNGLLALLLLAVTLNGAPLAKATAQESRTATTESPSRFVDADFLDRKIHILASDSLMGRGTGQPGSPMAADFIDRFYTSVTGTPVESISVMRQPFTLEGFFWNSVYYDLYHTDGLDTVFYSQTHLEKGGEAGFFPLLDGGREHDAPIVFAGYARFDRGDEISGTITEALENSWALVFEPGTDDQRTRADIVRYLSRNYSATGVIFITDKDTDEWEHKAREMSRQLERPRGIRRPGTRYRMGDWSPGLAVSVHPDLALGMLGLETPRQLDSVRTHWQGHTSSPVPEQTGLRLRNRPVSESRSFEEDNVVAVIPGADEELSREIVVLSAHYDHMGLGQPDDNNDIIYSGADDNASGTAVLMQVAKAFLQAAEEGYRPSRTLVFLHAAAEEWGLFGSRYFVDNPLFPDSDIIVNVNVDMVGFVDNEYARREEQDYIYVIGAGMVSSMLEELVQQANEATAKLILDETYNDTTHRLQLYRRSDHWPFAQQNIPFVFFFSGLHDHYHRPSDTPDRIDIPLLTERAKLVTELTWYLADLENRPETDRLEFGENAVPSR